MIHEACSYVYASPILVQIKHSRSDSFLICLRGERCAWKNPVKWDRQSPGAVTAVVAANSFFCEIAQIFFLFSIRIFH